MLRASLVVSSLFAALPASAGAQLMDVDVRSSSDRVDVVLHTDAPPTFQSWSRAMPAVLVVDLLETATQPRTLTPGGLVESIAVTSTSVQGLESSRLEMRLARDAEYDVSAQGNSVVVSLFPAHSENKAGVSAMRGLHVAQPVVLALNTARGVRSDVPARGVVEGSVGRATGELRMAQAEAGKRQMTYIGFKNTASQSRLFARMNAESKYTVRKEGDNLVILEIENAAIPLRNNRNHLDTTFFESPVKMITPSEVDAANPMVRIAIEMKEAAPYEAKLEGRDIVITFKK